MWLREQRRRWRRCVDVEPDEVDGHDALGREGDLREPERCGAACVDPRRHRGRDSSWYEAEVAIAPLCPLNGEFCI